MYISVCVCVCACVRLCVYGERERKHSLNIAHILTGTRLRSITQSYYYSIILLLNHTITQSYYCSIILLLNNTIIQSYYYSII